MTSSLFILFTPSPTPTCACTTSSGPAFDLMASELQISFNFQWFLVATWTAATAAQAPFY